MINIITTCGCQCLSRTEVKWATWASWELPDSLAYPGSIHLAPGGQLSPSTLLRNPQPVGLLHTLRTKSQGLPTTSTPLSTRILGPPHHVLQSGPLKCVTREYSPSPKPASLPPPQRRDAAAAAKALQSCPTLCDPIDGSPPGSPIPGILQARTLLQCMSLALLSF